MLPGCQNFPPKFSLKPTMSSTSPEPVLSSSPPWSLCAIIESTPEPLRRRSRPRSSPFMHRHLPRLESVMPSTTQVLSPNLRCCSWTHNNIFLPEPTTLCTWCHSRACDTVDQRRPQAHSVVVLPEPTTSLSLQRRRPPQALKATILYIFLFHFGTTNHDFDMLHCFHSAALLWCATLPHCFDMLYCL
jgi:hypothetical protein